MPDTDRLLAEFKLEMGILNDLGAAADLLSWDQDTYMPSGAAAGRGQQLATLHSIHHARLTSERVSDLLAALESAGLPADSPERAMVREARRHADRARSVPARLVEELARRSSSARVAWSRARAEDRFELFAPELAEMFALKREEADAVGGGSRYDALLDEYEPGATAAGLAELFEPLRVEQVGLLEAIRASGVQHPAGMLERGYPVAAQRDLCLRTVAAFGYDLDRGRLDVTLHPFATTIGGDDVRITTRYDEHFLNTALFDAMHEAGHAMYEQGIDPAYHRTPLASGASLGVHESQSRLWENLVGRSLPYWQGAYPALQAAFPAQLGEVALADFYRAINRVEGSLIRVEADEVSYNLHVLVRFELELALLQGDLAVADLPGAWNELYGEYLGLAPASDADGCLQDIHWAAGLIGYFPTYALGNLMSAQLAAAARRAEPHLDEALSAGDFAPLLAWLRVNVHRHGCRYRPEELLAQATGSGLSAGPYMTYLREKYGELYSL